MTTRRALARFGASVDVATYEFENIAAGPLDALAAEAPLYPPRRALEIAQDRLAEKEFVARLGGRPPRSRRSTSREELDAALAGARHARDPQDPPLRL
jgi:5-(carboxyamino)imidazole ribonucleotide synthase